MKTVKNLVVGAGISGATLAQLLAECGDSVMAIDSKTHNAGNCYDYRDDGIMVHQYGTHIFHTRNKAVWNLLSEMCKRFKYLFFIEITNDFRCFHLKLQL